MTLHMVGLVSDESSHEVAEPYQIADRGFYARGVKRGLDIALVLIALPIVLPVVLVLAAILALDGGKPFYNQARLGMGGKVYRMWKLRTMVHDADARLEAYLNSNPAAREEWERTQKLKNDPRITRFGAILRKTSLDELPQLWNVFWGQMSIVGPRPMMPCQRALYPGRDYEFLRPGITGPWQVSKRNLCSFADRASYDSLYRERISLGTDIRLIVATFRVVLRGTGY